MKGGAMQAVRTFWSARNARERTMLTAAIAVIVLGLTYALLIDPALSGREQLTQTLPTLRQQAAEVRALTREAGGDTARSAAPVAAVSRASLEAALARSGLNADEITVSGTTVRMRFQEVSFAGLTEWLAQQHRSARLAVVETKIEAGSEAASPDRVSAALTLRQERNGQEQ